MSPIIPDLISELPTSRLGIFLSEAQSTRRHAEDSLQSFAQSAELTLPNVDPVFVDPFG